MKTHFLHKTSASFARNRAVLTGTMITLMDRDFDFNSVFYICIPTAADHFRENDLWINFAV